MVDGLRGLARRADAGRLEHDVHARDDEVPHDGRVDLLRYVPRRGCDGVQLRHVSVEVAMRVEGRELGFRTVPGKDGERVYKTLLILNRREGSIDS